MTKAFVCSQCGNTDFDAQLDGHYKCRFCNSLLILDEEQLPEEDRLLRNASAWLKTDDTSEAYSCYMQVTRRCPGDYRGWLGLALLDSDVKNLSITGCSLGGAIGRCNAISGELDNIEKNYERAIKHSGSFANQIRNIMRPKLENIKERIIDEGNASLKAKSQQISDAKKNLAQTIAAVPKKQPKYEGEILIRFGLIVAGIGLLAALMTDDGSVFAFGAVAAAIGFWLHSKYRAYWKAVDNNRSAASNYSSITDGRTVEDLKLAVDNLVARVDKLLAM